MFHKAKLAENAEFSGFLVHSITTSDKVLRYGKFNQIEYSEHPTVVQRGNERTINIYAAVPDQIEFSFELNKHNKILLAQIQNAEESASALQRYPGSFSETLVQLMKDKKLSAKKLADESLVGEKTIQRLRNNEEYPTTKQTVLGLCYGLKLSIPEAEMLLSKTEFSLKGTTPENNVYRCTLGSCAELSIYEVNEMLVANGYRPFGSSPAE